MPSSASRACSSSTSCDVFDPGAAHMSSTRWCDCTSSSSAGTIDTVSCRQMSPLPTYLTRNWCSGLSEGCLRMSSRAHGIWKASPSGYQGSGAGRRADSFSSSSGEKSRVPSLRGAAETTFTGASRKSTRSASSFEATGECRKMRQLHASGVRMAASIAWKARSSRSGRPGPARASATDDGTRGSPFLRSGSPAPSVAAPPSPPAPPAAAATAAASASASSAGRSSVAIGEPSMSHATSGNVDSTGASCRR
mmetsp:Transcript_5588/g.19970  ORF Transcript_5588/g.19970 Transcript_5588/m.19970 type:complete len:251 (+) Transcript_5588:1876-2628(+)